MAKNVNCRYCKGTGTVITELNLFQGSEEPSLRALCTKCGRASRWIDQESWRGVGFHSGQLRAQESSPEASGAPADLIPIAQAAKMLGKHPNTISTRINLGQIPSYPNGLARHPKKRQRLVSWAEILGIYGIVEQPASTQVQVEAQALLDRYLGL